MSGDSKTTLGVFDGTYLVTQLRTTCRIVTLQHTHTHTHGRTVTHLHSGKHLTSEFRKAFLPLGRVKSYFPPRCRSLI